MEFAYKIVDSAVTTFDRHELNKLQVSLTELGSLCLAPLPNYQVFDMDLERAFADKILVIARQGATIAGFVSAVKLDIPGLDHPAIHSGLTCIHPIHRRARGALRHLFAELFLHILHQHPGGVWMTTVTDRVSSLVQMSKYTVNNYPAPSSTAASSLSPDPIHLHIGRSFSATLRHTCLVSPRAELDESSFVFRGSNDHDAALAFKKDIDDPAHWHRDHEASHFYRGLLRPGYGDEVLLVGFLDPQRLKALTRGDQLRDQWQERFAKL
ncbi:hypothetical protein F4778DRAFT_84366 [Xylariomycetidae sp. FL2044]|nr:hypothetical protein F4778DRAFT_84366 [Xylariomycetidae sp. FL2044]